MNRGSLVVLFLTLLFAVPAVLVLLLLVLLVPHLLVDNLGVLVVGVAHFLVDVVAVVVLLVVIVLLIVAVGEVLRVSLEVVLHLDALGLFLLVAVRPFALVLLLLFHVLHAHDLLLVLDLVADVLLSLAGAHAGAALIVHQLAAILAILAPVAILAAVAETLGAQTHDEAA